ncbi:MAG: hypothetical protein HRU40_20525 [Saprospiraceae bacterium]|nr:hypothetical protein [Saprospiraceae bacterium]
MKQSEFILICNNNCIDPSIALENESVYQFLIRAKEKYKNCKTNAAMVELQKIIEANF